MLNGILQFIRDWKPDTFIVGGDMCEFESVSAWNKGKPLLMEGQRLKKDFDGGNKLLDLFDELLPKHCDKRYITGNHEDRVRRAIEVSPELKGLIDFDTNLYLKERKYQVIPLNHSTRVGKITFIHGNQLFGTMGYGSVFHAKKAVDLYADCNVVYGDRHTHQVFTKVTPENVHAYQGTCVPCVGEVNPDWCHGRPNAWINGFYFAYVDPDGYFTDYVTKIFRGRFVVNDTLYDGRQGVQYL